MLFQGETSFEYRNGRIERSKYRRIIGIGRKHTYTISLKLALKGLGG
jgi:hypothetical protein